MKNLVGILAISLFALSGCAKKTAVATHQHSNPKNSASGKQNPNPRYNHTSSPIPE